MPLPEARTEACTRTIVEGEALMFGGGTRASGSFHHALARVQGFEPQLICSERSVRFHGESPQSTSGNLRAERCALEPPLSRAAVLNACLLITMSIPVRFNPFALETA